MLAHHSTGALSKLAYSRDALSGPLRKLETLLGQVRIGAFCPDSTRSGYWKSAPGPDCAESSLGSWDCVAKDVRAFARDLPVLRCPDEGSPSGHRGPAPARRRALHCRRCQGSARDEDSPSAAPVEDDQQSSGPELSEPSHCEVCASESAWEDGIQQALLLQMEDQEEAAVIDPDSSQDTSSDSFSDEEAGQAPLLHLPERWSAIQNVKSTMLHLHKEGGTALKCGPWISHNFIRMDRPSTAWVKCSRCFS